MLFQATGGNAYDTTSPERTNLGRLLRNLCAGGSEAKAILVAEGVATAAADWAAASAEGTVVWHLRQRSNR